MNGPEINGWSSRLPEWVDGELDPAERALLEEALARDPDLRSEAELVRAMKDARPEPPADLAASIVGRLNAERAATASRSRLLRGWRLSTAAILVLAMGTAVIWQNRFGTLPTFSNVSSTQVPLSDSWLLDDGVVAGGAVLDDLSDEELALFLDELESS